MKRKFEETTITPMLRYSEPSAKKAKIIVFTKILPMITMSTKNY